MSVLAGWESTAARATLPVGRLRDIQLPRPRLDARRQARPDRADVASDGRPGLRTGPSSAVRPDVRPGLRTGLPSAVWPDVRPEPPAPRTRRRPRPRSVARPAGLAVALPSRQPVVACAPPYGRRRLVALLVLAVATAAVVAGLLALRAAAADDGVPQRTAVVEVRGGETLWDVAERVAPDSSPQAVVERIRELNGMRGSTVHPGQPLLVPDGR